MPTIVYLAAPLFTQAERLWNQRLANAIESRQLDIAVFLPQRDAESHTINGDIDLNHVYRRCIEGVDGADVVVAVLDGSDADSGTCFECGYALAQGKKIIGVRTDFRKGEVHGTNLMLHHSVHAFIESPANQFNTSTIESLAVKVRATINQLCCVT